MSGRPAHVPPGAFALPGLTGGSSNGQGTGHDGLLAGPTPGVTASGYGQPTTGAPVIDPAMPYRGPLPKFVDGLMIMIQGRLLPQATEFSLDLLCDDTCESLNANPSNIALRLWTRLEGDAVIGRNSCERGQWGAEERGGGAPAEFQIAKGQDFEFIILVTNSAYKVALCGRHFCEFAHRLDKGRVTTLVVRGDVQFGGVCCRPPTNQTPVSLHSEPSNKPDNHSPNSPQTHSLEPSAPFIEPDATPLVDFGWPSDSFPSTAPQNITPSSGYQVFPPHDLTPNPTIPSYPAVPPRDPAPMNFGGFPARGSVDAVFPPRDPASFGFPVRGDAASGGFPTRSQFDEFTPPKRPSVPSEVPPVDMYGQVPQPGYFAGAANNGMPSYTAVGNSDGKSPYLAVPGFPASTGFPTSSGFPSSMPAAGGFSPYPAAPAFGGTADGIYPPVFPPSSLRGVPPVSRGISAPPAIGFMPSYVPPGPVGRLSAGGGLAMPSLSSPSSAGVPMKQFVDGLKLRQIITIVATPHPNASWFTVAFKPSDDSLDTAFLLYANFVECSLKRNGLCKGAWGVEETHLAYFPFNRGQQFSLIVLCEQEVFKVAVNGTHLLEFRHRGGMIPQCVHSLRINGDVTVHRIA